MVTSSLPADAWAWPSVAWVSHWDLPSGTLPAQPARTMTPPLSVPSQGNNPMTRTVKWGRQLAGNYPSADLAGLMRWSRGLTGVSLFSLQGTSNSLLQVSVGFADSTSASANFPEPWNEANPLVRFVGGGVSYRAGAIRLDNPTGSDITLDNVTVDLGRPGPVFSLW